MKQERGVKESLDLTCRTTHTLTTMKLQMKREGFHSRSPLGPSICSESIQVSPAAILNSVMNALLNFPNWSGEMSEKSDTPRMASAVVCGVHTSQEFCALGVGLIAICRTLTDA